MTAEHTLRLTQRFFVSGGLATGGDAPLNDDQTHQLLHVLRARAGDVLRLFNGRDGEFRAEVESVGKREVQIAVREQIRAQTAEPDLWLCPAPIKKAHFDYMMEKATELGVCEIQPILTHRTQVREINGDRIYGICKEAAEQSERLSVPAIGLPVSLDDFIDVFPKDRVAIVCAEMGEAAPVAQALSALKGQPKAAVITGPEGGFAAEEFEKLRTLPHVVFVRLGPRILRADTAAIAALTCWQAIQGDWN